MVKAKSDYEVLVKAHNSNVDAYNKAATAWNADPKLNLNEVVRLTPKTSVGGMKIPTGPALHIDIDNTSSGFDSAAYKATPFNSAIASFT